MVVNYPPGTHDIGIYQEPVEGGRRLSWLFRIRNGVIEYETYSGDTKVYPFRKIGFCGNFLEQRKGECEEWLYQRICELGWVPGIKTLPSPDDLKAVDWLAVKFSLQQIVELLAEEAKQERGLPYRVAEAITIARNALEDLEADNATDD
jgi:hypothetical protein